MKDYNELADAIVKSTVYLKGKLFACNIHLDRASSISQYFAEAIIDYEFGKLRAKEIKELGDLATTLKDLGE